MTVDTQQIIAMHCIRTNNGIDDYTRNPHFYTFHHFLTFHLQKTLSVWALGSQKYLLYTSRKHSFSSSNASTETSRTWGILNNSCHLQFPPQIKDEKNRTYFQNSKLFFNFYSQSKNNRQSKNANKNKNYNLKKHAQTSSWSGWTEETNSLRKSSSSSPSMKPLPSVS